MRAHVVQALDIAGQERGAFFFSKIELGNSAGRVSQDPLAEQRIAIDLPADFENVVGAHLLFTAVTLTIQAPGGERGATVVAQLQHVGLACADGA
jgi:hypothetical protein